MSGENEQKMGISMLGDIVISTDTAKREAEEMGETLECTIYRLLIHGLLHLLGYEHEGSEREAKRMSDLEKKLLLKIKGGEG